MREVPSNDEDRKQRSVAGCDLVGQAQEIGAGNVRRPVHEISLVI
jgi:hypothetical protein